MGVLAFVQDRSHDAVAVSRHPIALITSTAGHPRGCQRPRAWPGRMTLEKSQDRVLGSLARRSHCCFFRRLIGEQLAWYVAQSTAHGVVINSLVPHVSPPRVPLCWLKATLARSPTASSSVLLCRQRTEGTEREGPRSCCFHARSITPFNANDTFRNATEAAFIHFPVNSPSLPSTTQ